MFRHGPARWVLLAAFVLPLLFAAFTGHAWEDYFITLRSSRNLVEGHGLVFNPGERLHTFTSPLGVLVPALCTAIAGSGREEIALWLFRLINAGFLAGCAALVWRRAQSLGLGRIGLLTFFGLMLADAKLTDFSINGMETALLVFFMLLLWSELEAPDGPRATRLAFAIAGLMWTRPDAFVLGGVLLIAHVALRQRRTPQPNSPASSAPSSPAPSPLAPSSPALATTRTSIAWSPLLRGILLGGALYLPWFAWAWWYYGTPVPHTIIAKSAYTPSVHLSALLLQPWQVLKGDSLLVDLFLPSYWTFGGWPPALKHLAHALSIVVTFAWLVPRLPLTARRASLALFFGQFYVGSIILFPWYVPPWSVLAALALAFTLDGLYASATRAALPALATLARAACLLLVAVQAGQWLASAWQMRIQQTLVETGVRRQVGEWLHAHAARGDTVFLEPLGYIGYFSQLKTLDFPGLSSPEVVATVRGGARRYADIIATLAPTWVVLRPSEAARPEFRDRPVLNDYELAQSWSALPQLNAVAILPGRAWVEAESSYLVFRRKTSAAAPVRRP